MFTLAIVGRPNVGKSTLFNRLVGRRQALVDDRPGVTRDRREGEGRLGALRFRVVDTAGYEEADAASLAGRMRRQTERAVAEADVALLLVDARAGVTPLDESFAGWLRAAGTPVLLAANKAEGRAGEPGVYEAYGLGLGEPIALSAAHGEGLEALAEALLPFDRAAGREAAEAAEAEALARAHEVTADGAVDAERATEMALDAASEPPPGPLQLAIVGRPNVGKSTLLNALVGRDRVLTGPEPGITRDAIAVDWQWRGQPVRLVDTAGMRRRARVDEALEKLSVADARRALGLANVVVLVLDAGLGLERQDLTIARHVLDEGRALVVAINKWDAVDDGRTALRQVRERLEISLPQARGVPVVTLSALHRRRLGALMDAVLGAYGLWTTRLATAELNRWLAGMVEAHPPPVVAGRRLKLRYMTQVKARPPTFVVWTTRPDELPEGYRRYLIQGLRDAFGLWGVPVRLFLRKGRNPYAAG